MSDYCLWQIGDYEWNTWESECGLYWQFNSEGTPRKHNMNYCPKCGKELAEELEE